MSDRRVYDRIGVTYARTRREDPRLAGAIHGALGSADSVVNVGAGPGSYEPKDRWVVAVEPSITMLRQRPPGSAQAVRAAAEALPLADGAVAAAMATLTVHHWRDPGAGLAEMRRVARERVVVLTWDPASDGFWLTRDYFPAFLEQDRRRFPAIAFLADRLGGAQVLTVPIPHDCEDGFLGAFWRRPAAYLEAAVRAGMSRFSLSDDLSPLAALERDLRSGAWEARYGDVLGVDALDLGYRLVVCGA